MVWKLLLVLESEMEIFRQVHTSGNWRNYTIRVSKGAARERQPHLRLNITLVQLAFPSGSSVGLTETTGSSSQSLGQEPSWRPKFHPLGWRWRASGHTNDLSVLFFWHKSEWNANTNLPQKIAGEEQLRGADVKFGGQITCYGEKKFYIFAFRPQWSWKAT